MDAKALLCPTPPNKPQIKPVLLTNRFICILTGAQILDTDFFCTTVQEPVQNMLFYLFIHVQKNPKNQQTKRQRVWQYLLTTGMPQPPINPPPLALAHHANFVASTACLPLTAALSVKRGNSPLKDKHPKQTKTRAGYFKKLGTPSGHQCIPRRGAKF